MVGSHYAFPRQREYAEENFSGMPFPNPMFQMEILTAEPTEIGGETAGLGSESDSWFCCFLVSFCEIQFTVP